MMGNFSDSSPTSQFSGQSAGQEQDTDLIQSQVQAGLDAVKRKAYSEAIDRLSHLDLSTLDAASWLKVQMALVKAYAETGQIDRAVGICQPLQNSPNPQVQTWADQTLAKLSRRPGRQTPELVEDRAARLEPETGFVPFSPGSGSDSALDQTGFDQTGFDQTGFDQTGFVPLSASATGNRSDNRDVIRPVAHTPTSPAAPTTPETDPELEDLSAYLGSDATTSIPTGATPAEAGTPTPSIDSNSPTDPESPITSLLQVNSGAISTSATHPILATSRQWRQAGRAQKWTSLGKLDRSPLWALEAGTVVALIGSLHLLVLFIQALVNRFFGMLNAIRLLPYLWWNAIPFWLIAIGVIALLAASPWLLRFILQQIYGLQPLSTSELEAYSPEAFRLVKRVSNQRRQPVPRLELVPDAAPFAFSYGHLPGQTHIVVSQGLLSLLNDDEIAAIYATELEHITNWSFAILSGLVLVAQLPYLVYSRVAPWGDRQHDRVLQSVAVLVSSASYGLYRFCRLAGLWLSRVRLYYSDRVATDLTGNPNGLTRALLKLTIGLAAQTQQQSATSSVLESFEMLMPVSSRNALTLGSLYPAFATPALLEWDRSQPYRHWLSINNTHPPLGDRLNFLTGYAQHWRLEAELDWKSLKGTAPVHVSRYRFLQQGKPYLGALLGLGVASLLTLLGWIADRVNWLVLDWLWFDRGAIFQSCVLLGFGIGLLLQINPLFPDIRRSNLAANSNLIELLSDPTTLPIDSTPVRFQGHLIGRQGFTNRFYPDLLLQTQTGMIRLYYTSRAGFLGNLASQARRPTDLMQQRDPVTVTGWLRRGVTPLLEVETIQTKRGSVIRNGHPVWSTTVALISILLGIYAILRGGL